MLVAIAFSGPGYKPTLQTRPNFMFKGGWAYTYVSTVDNLYTKGINILNIIIDYKSLKKIY